MQKTEQAILRTLAYYDIFDFPLTHFELWKYLWCSERISLHDVVSLLESSDGLKERIVQKKGFVMLKGKEGIIDIRLRRYARSIDFWHRAFKGIRWLRFIPFIEMVAVCNTLSWHNVKEGSDIDLYIVTKPGKIWTARFLAVTLINLLGIRRHGQKIAKRLCLSFFVTNKSLNLEPVALEDGDPYLLYYTAQVSPVFIQNEMDKKFWQANKWVKKTLPNIFPVEQVSWPRQIKHNWFTKTVQVGLEFILATWLGVGVEKLLRSFQKQKMKRNIDSKQFEQGTAVVISDDMLKFHEKDTRGNLKHDLFKKLRNLGVNN